MNADMVRDMRFFMRGLDKKLFPPHIEETITGYNYLALAQSEARVHMPLEALIMTVHREVSKTQG